MAEPKPKPAGRTSIAAACVFVLLLLAGYEVQKHRESGPAPDPRSFPVRAGSPEAQLAALQLGVRPRWKSSTVRRLAWLLDILAADCPATSRQELADLTARALRELRRSGIAATPTQVLGGVEGLDDIGSRAECAPFFERYVVQRRQAPREPQ